MYEIPSLDCYRKYVDETSRSLDKRIYKHKRDFKRADMKYGLVKNNLDTNHNKIPKC